MGKYTTQSQRYLSYFKGKLLHRHIKITQCAIIHIKYILTASEYQFQ